MPDNQATQAAFYDLLNGSKHGLSLVAEELQDSTYIIRVTLVIYTQNLQRVDLAKVTQRFCAFVYRDGLFLLLLLFSTSISIKHGKLTLVLKLYIKIIFSPLAPSFCLSLIFTEQNDPV